MSKLLTKSARLKLSAIITLLLLTGWVSADAMAQEESKKKPMPPPKELEKIVDYDQDMLIDYGGWMHVEFISFDDKPTRDHRRLRYYDLRLWGSMDWGERVKLYARMQGDYTQYNLGDAYDDHDNNTSSRTRLDQGYIETDLTGLIWDPSVRLTARAGRQFFHLGSGLVYSNVHDGLAIELDTSPFSVTLLAAHSVTDVSDIDQSRPEKDRTYRFFAGGEVSYSGISNLRTYAFTLLQRDLNDENPENDLQDYEYNSEYFGLGARINPLPRFSLQGEYILETGHSVATGSTETETIRAYAYSMTAQYLLDFYAHPQFSAQFLYGSGDSDRSSPLNTSGGNLEGTDDRSFAPFGYIQTGYSLFPKLSNLSIVKLGADFKPFENWSDFDDLAMGVVYYMYKKNESEGGISDSRAFNDSADVGSEVDAIMRWRITSDFGVDAIYAVFFPGDAYDTTNERNYISFGITYNF